jgi:hypothetical protein
MTRDEIERAMAKLPSLTTIRAEQERRRPRPINWDDKSDPRVRVMERLEKIAENQQHFAATGTDHPPAACIRWGGPAYPNTPVIVQSGESLAEQCARTLWDPAITEEQSERIWGQVRELLRRSKTYDGSAEPGRPGNGASPSSAQGHCGIPRSMPVRTLAFFLAGLLPRLAGWFTKGVAIPPGSLGRG